MCDILIKPLTMSYIAIIIAPNAVIQSSLILSILVGFVKSESSISPDSTGNALLNGICIVLPLPLSPLLLPPVVICDVKQIETISTLIIYT